MGCVFMCQSDADVHRHHNYYDIGAATPGSEVRTVQTEGKIIQNSGY